MNKIKIFLPVFLLVVVGMLALSSCEKNEEVVDNSNFLLPDFIGEQHNNCIEYAYINAKLKSGNSDLENLNMFIEYFGEYLITVEGMNTDDVNEAVEIAKQEVPKHLSQIRDLGNDLEAYSDYIDIVSDERGYSVELKNVLKSPLDGSSMSDINTLISQIETALNSTSFLENEQIIAEVYYEVAVNSANLWGNEQKNVKVDPDSETIIIDAIGGVTGSVFGGIPAIIIGAAFSVAHEENWLPDDK